MSVEDIRSQFSCSICLDTFKDPVTTECEHDFCRPCITEYWDREETSICPLCRQYSSGILRTNRTLACVVEILQSKKDSSEEADACGENNFGFLLLVILISVIVLLWSVSPDASSLGFYPKDYDMCPQHKEKLKLFCEDDQELLCLICRDSNKHVNHQVFPISEAARIYKKELSTTLELLKMKHIHHQIIKSSYDDNMTLLMDDVTMTEQHIRQVFVRLHEFLRMEEESIMRELHNEAWQRFTVLQEIIIQLDFESTALSDIIRVVSEELMQEDAILFLMNMKLIQERVKMAVSNPQKVSVMLDSAKYKFLLMYSSWKKMVHEIGFNPVPLSLDPETAHRDLLIFNNMTNVIFSQSLTKPPDTSSRFVIHPFVLAQQGLSSGVHYWEVYVGCKTGWIIGVTKESVERKSPISLTPQDGLWTLERRNRHYVANDEPQVVIFSGYRAQIIGVYLDYDRGHVAFYNADYMNRIYTFRDTFTETMYPLFSPGFNFTPLRIIHINPLKGSVVK
ncbi:nuclear factor 7, brain-like [Leucoraja erinacea]|uniref:nuclear factor 7, brain-like n=1 Tax=Leucoraja erinaceus TaxID=7782 RepID=UPI00245511B2|nr:nuclear factor 7, brain-like [Leucoraja erinacea]XP_055513039.1 nuclear factor 7, brain-like [Leucoraja erinacea]